MIELLAVCEGLIVVDTVNVALGFEEEERLPLTVGVGEPRADRLLEVVFEGTVERETESEISVDEEIFADADDVFDADILPEAVDVGVCEGEGFGVTLS